MRNFSFVVQSGTTLDAPSMKSVRSHVTREQMKKRRTLLEQQQQQQQQQQEQLQHAGSDKAQQQQQHKPDPPPPRKARPLTSKTKRNPRGKKKVIPEDQDEQVEMEIRRREEHDDDRHSSSTAPHLLLQSDHTSASTSATSSSAAVVAVAPTCCSSPSGQLTGTAAEFTSMPFSRRRMMQFFNRYYEFMGLYSVASPGIESEYSPFAGQLQQESFTNPAWLTSIALVATQKLDIYRERETTDLLKYKALALNALSKKIKASEVEETTILSVIAFFTYEVLASDGTPETESAVMAHYHGILAYVKSKGGPAALAEQSPAYGPFIVRSALSYETIYSIKRNRDPLSVPVDPPKLRTFHQAADGMREPYFVGGPLLWPSSHAEQGSPEALEVLEDHQLFTTDIKTMLFDLFTATELLYMEYHRVSEESTRATLSSLRGAIRLPPEPCTSVGIMERRASVMARIARACWLAGSVYLRAVVHEIPLTDPANAEPITELHKLLKNLDIQAWATMPYIHLWISLVGVGAAVNATQKRFYAVQTGRCGILFGSRWWDNYRQVVLNFVWLQKLLRGEIEKGGDAAPSLGSPEQHPDGGQGVDDMESSTYLLTPPDSSGDIRDTDELDFCDNPKT